MEKGDKVVRCGARKSVATCTSSDQCKWDSAEQKCKQKGPTIHKVQEEIPTEIKQAIQNKPSYVKSLDCNVKTKAACIKREICTWVDKVCKENTISNHGPASPKIKVYSH